MAMICTPGFILGQQGSESYKQRATGGGPTFQERKRIRLSYELCGGTMAASSLRQHMERTHGIVFLQVRGGDVGGEGLEVYKVSFPWILNIVD